MGFLSPLYLHHGWSHQVKVGSKSYIKFQKKYWSKIKTRKFQTGVKDEDGSVEQIELRWNGTQSIVSGKHPKTDGYRWMENRSPKDLEIAELPCHN